MKFAFIEQHARTWPVRNVPHARRVAARGYYDWRDRPPSAREAANAALPGDVQRFQSGITVTTDRRACILCCARKNTDAAVDGWSA